MQLYRENDAPAADVRVTCRTARWPSVLVTAIVVGAGAGWTAAAVLLNESGATGWLLRGFLGLMGAVCLLVGSFVLLPHAAGTFSSANWVMKIGNDGLLVKFRSFANRHFPAEDPVVAFVPVTELASACRRRERRTVPGSRGEADTAYTLTSIELHLSHERTAELAAAVKRERALPPMGTQRSKSKTHDYPVSVPAPGVVRVQWTGAKARMTPGLARVLRALALLCPIDEDVRVDRGDWADLSERELEDYLLDLLETGDVMAARKIARIRYGYSLAQAERLTAELTGKR